MQMRLPLISLIGARQDTSLRRLKRLAVLALCHVFKLDLLDQASHDVVDFPFLKTLLLSYDRNVVEGTAGAEHG